MLFCRKFGEDNVFYSFQAKALELCRQGTHVVAGNTKDLRKPKEN